VLELLNGRLSSRNLERNVPSDASSIAALFDSSYALRFRDPARMLKLAQQATSAADAVSLASKTGRTDSADLRARAWGLLSNAYRIAGQLELAGEALQTAERYWRQGSLASPLRTELLLRSAALATASGQLARAVALSRECAELCDGLGQQQERAAAKIQEAVAELYSSAPAAASRLLTCVLPLCDSLRRPELALAARHNLMRCYIDLQRPEDAIVHHVQARDLYRKVSEPLVLLRASWQEGLLLAEVGHTRNAEAALRRTRAGFEVLGLNIEAGKAALDLARMLEKDRRLDLAQESAQRAEANFNRIGAAKEASTARQYLQRFGATPSA
jgi:tetratricopeptide (TPR) repeat protein